jgi:hypothetical protein
LHSSIALIAFSFNFSEPVALVSSQSALVLSGDGRGKLLSVDPPAGTGALAMQFAVLVLAQTQVGILVGSRMWLGFPSLFVLTLTIFALCVSLRCTSAGRCDAATRSQRCG